MIRGGRNGAQRQRQVFSTTPPRHHAQDRPQGCRAWVRLRGARRAPPTRPCRAPAATPSPPPPPPPCSSPRHPTVGGGGKPPGQLFASLLDEMSASAARDIEALVAGADLGGKVAARARAFRAHCLAKRNEAKEARKQAADTVQEVVAANDAKLVRWGARGRLSRSGARAGARGGRGGRPPPPAQAPRAPAPCAGHSHPRAPHRGACAGPVGVRRRRRQGPGGGVRGRDQARRRRHARPRGDRDGPAQGQVRARCGQGAGVNGT